MHECFPKHLRMGTARTKEDNETDEDTQKRGVSMEKSTQVLLKEEVPTAYHILIEIQ